MSSEKLKKKLLHDFLAMTPDEREKFIAALDKEQLKIFNQILTPITSRYNPTVNSNTGEKFELNPKQKLAVLMDNRVLLMGGGGGSGKSVCLLYMALQYADHPKYSGLIVMRNLPNLVNLIRMSEDWLSGTGASYNKVDKIWHFPEGGTLQFGYCDADDDVYRYKSFEYQFIGFDELTRFKKQESFTYLFSRLRKPHGIDIPLRIRAATNPGDIGGPWVYNYFINPETKVPKTAYIHLNMTDNRFLDIDEYEKSLEGMSAIERARMQYGDWDVSDTDLMINPKWFNVVKSRPEPDFKNAVRVWDIASTKLASKNHDPDFTAGALCSYKSGVFTIENVIRLRGTPREVEQKIIQTYEKDSERFGTELLTLIELGNNSGSKIAVDQLLRGPFAGMQIKPISSNVPKEERARPFAVAAENGYVNIMEGDWNAALLEECKTFPNDKFHDDCIDAAVYAYTHLVVLRKKYKSKVTNLGGPRQWTNKQMLTVLRSR